MVMALEMAGLPLEQARLDVSRQVITSEPLTEGNV
jgi:hypothetical protein